MAATITLTTGDTAPTLTGQVNADLTGASAEIHMVRPDGTVLDRAVDITDHAEGEWSLTWGPGDLNQRGFHFVEIEVTFSNDQIQTFAFGPDGRLQKFLVREEYA